METETYYSETDVKAICLEYERRLSALRQTHGFQRQRFYQRFATMTRELGMLRWATAIAMAYATLATLCWLLT